MEEISTNTKAAAQVMSHFVNSLSPDYKGFCNIMANDHPTLQQAFTKLSLEWIKTMADRDERFTDLRNESSYKICNKIKALLLEEYGENWTYLPTI